MYKNNKVSMLQAPAAEGSMGENLQGLKNFPHDVCDYDPAEVRAINLKRAQQLFKVIWQNWRQTMKNCLCIEMVTFDFFHFVYSSSTTHWTTHILFILKIIVHFPSISKASLTFVLNAFQLIERNKSPFQFNNCNHY